MAETGPVVADSGPLIALATVRQMDLVGKLYGAVLVPGAVLREVTSFGSNRPGAAELAAAAWAVRIELAPPPDPLLAGDTGPGEAEAITLAVRRGARLLTSSRGRTDVMSPCFFAATRRPAAPLTRRP